LITRQVIVINIVTHMHAPIGVKSSIMSPKNDANTLIKKPSFAERSARLSESLTLLKR